MEAVSVLGRSPRRGAWIEIKYFREHVTKIHVAPRVGERGLKSVVAAHEKAEKGRSPRRGAWIEIPAILWNTGQLSVAPRVGERGLKYEIRM